MNASITGSAPAGELQIVILLFPQVTQLDLTGPAQVCMSANEEVAKVPCEAGRLQLRGENDLSLRMSALA